MSWAIYQVTEAQLLCQKVPGLSPKLPQPVCLGTLHAIKHALWLSHLALKCLLLLAVYFHTAGHLQPLAKPPNPITLTANIFSIPFKHLIYCAH